MLSVQHLELFAVVFELSLVAMIQASGQALEEVLCRAGLGKEPSSRECPDQIGTVGNYDLCMICNRGSPACTRLHGVGVNYMLLNV